MDVLICEWCKQPLPDHPRYRYPSQRPRTCSRGCGLRLAYAEKRLAPPVPVKDRGRCAMCGDPIKRGARMTCSRRCAVDLAMREGGYVQVQAPPEHPHRPKRGYIMEHRLVMEQMIGRYLQPYESVHHRNGVKDDNRPENLEIVTHARHRGEITCPHCQQSFFLH
jgi:endogenous inhibitor of DNA gyrase (YacG/DUF329 family)